MPRIHPRDMTSGQLKLDFAARCQFHQCDGVSAFAYADKAETEFLRSSLTAYYAEAKTQDLKGMETALVGVVDSVLKAAA